MKTDRIKTKRGYWGIAFYEPKYIENIGTAIRSAKCFGADFVSIIKGRYKQQSSDTSATERHIPIYEYENLEDFIKYLPIGCSIIGVEVDGNSIKNFIHPERAVYIFGGEDRTLPPTIKTRIKIETKHCLNMAVAASIIMFHRNENN